MTGDTDISLLRDTKSALFGPAQAGAWLTVTTHAINGPDFFGSGAYPSRQSSPPIPSRASRLTKRL
jgi:hypothetical protein